MRILLFPLILFSFSAFAQLDTGDGSDGACIETDLVSGGTFNCTTLTLSATPGFSSTAAPLIIKVQGSVLINNTFDMSGAPGSTVTTGTFSQVLGGEGGPGAGDGGGENGFVTLLPGLTTDATLQTPDATPGRGEEAMSGNPACGDGGGGGGLKSSGSAGVSCGGNGPGPAGGTVSPTLIFSGSFRGGFGGGAGGDSVSTDIGSGGGGGGAIRITAGGDITISGSIIANGGNGGDGAPDGGGGGAGSGGVIWLQTLGNIDISGSLSVAGGTGVNTGSGGAGGNGGDGFIRLEDADGVITGGGSFPDAETIALLPPISSSTPSLKSDISCGTIKPNKNENSAFFQMLMGFMLALGVSHLFNARRRRRRTEP